MRLLMFTRKIDNQDERVGFVTDWVLELAKNLDSPRFGEVGKLIVICQEKGDISNLPPNIEVHSLGKEKAYSKFRQILNLRFLILKNIKKVDGVFSHMIPHYAVFVGLFCKLYNKKLIQWYTHGKVNFWLKLANIFVDEFVTASKESLRLKTKKPVHIWGHGINVRRFEPISNFQFPISNKKQFTTLSVGRISPVKNYDLLIKAVENIQINEPKLRDKILVQIIGGPGLLSQESYYNELIEEVREKGLNSVIDFIGPLSQREVLPYYQNCNLFINLSETGSIDKAVLEAMACEKLILTLNEAFKNILPEKLFLSQKNVNELVKKIKELYSLSEDEKVKLQKELRQIVIENHNLERLIKKIINLYSGDPSSSDLTSGSSG